MLRTRLVTAFFLIPLILGSVYFGGLAFFLPVLAALVYAGYELFIMARNAGHHPSLTIGLALIALILLNAIYETEHWSVPGLTTNITRDVLTLTLIVSLVAAVFKHDEHWLVDWGITFAGALYVGWLGAFFILVRALPNGVIWTTFALATAWAADTGAYLAGTRMGKHKFFPKISPKKTWEGACGGWLAATLAMFAMGTLAGLPPLHSALLGLGIGIASSFGDLAESLLKRQTGVKDSGNIVPGHGGLLDRVDSLLFTAVFTYYYLVWILHI